MALALIGPIGAPELMIILFLALLMFGGRLPDVARSLGRSVNQFKRGLKDLDEGMKEEEQRLPTPPAKTLASPPSTQGTEGASATSAASSDTSSTAPH
jgi:sec-independent protein translocase protein TatA